MRGRFERLFFLIVASSPLPLARLLRVTPVHSWHFHAVRSKQGETYFFNFDVVVPGEPSSADLSVTPAAGAVVPFCSKTGTGVTASPVEAQTTVEEDTSENEVTSGASSTAFPAGGVVVTALGGIFAVIAGSRH